MVQGCQKFKAQDSRGSVVFVGSLGPGGIVQEVRELNRVG
jgi:hypothetical protein